MQMKKDDSMTEILKSKLLESEDVSEFIEHHEDNLDVVTFSDYLYIVLEKRNYKISEALQMSQLSESYGYQIFNGKRQPSRDKVLQLALGINLTLEETNRLLMLAGKSELYVKNQRDAVIMFALNKKWSLFTTEELLLERGLACIVTK